MKRKHLLWNLLVIAAVAAISLSTSSCKDHDPKLFLSETSVTLEATAGSSSSIGVTAENTDWTVTVIQGQGWLNAHKNGNMVTFTAEENKDATQRTGTAVVTATEDNKLSYTINIIQKPGNSSLTVNGSSSAEFTFPGFFDTGKSGIDYKQVFKIKSNVQWTMSGDVDWLNISSKSGNGDVDLTVYPTSENSSDEARTTKLTLSGAGVSATINITQDPALVPDCIVRPTNIIALYNGIAFGYSYGRNVAHFYRGYMEKSVVGTMSDNEIIETLTNNFDRNPVTDFDFTDFAGLDENTSYYIYTLAYNSEGKRGKLHKVEAKTKKRLDNWTLNEPMAWISEITQDGSYWYWQVTKGTRCRTYLEGVTQNESLAMSSDVCQAWLLDYWKRTNQIYEYENPEPLMMSKQGNCCAVFTWGKDNAGVWASCIDWQYADNMYSSVMKSKSNTTVKTDCDHKLPSKEDFIVRMITK